MNKKTILIADDEINTLKGLSAALSEKYRVITASNGQDAYELFTSNMPSIILTDIRMPVMGGLTLLDKIKSVNPDVPVILLTAYGTINNAVESMKRGASDYITKPVNLDKLEAIIEKFIDKKPKAAALRNQETIIGADAALKTIYEQAAKVALTDTTILITGESGTGKEILAQDIHKMSKRTGKFTPVHCAALTETLLESELFGHEKGSFTGASSRKAGRFEIAERGTIFLDEISEISTSIQTKLLRVLQDKAFERVGGTQTLKADIRIIAATNKNLGPLILSGRFREDLYYRLNVVHFHLPPLRERAADIPLFVNHFIEDLAKSSGKIIEGITDEAVSLLTGYPWPGNIRQLRNTIEHMILFSSSRILDIKDIPPEITKGLSLPAGKNIAAGKGTIKDLEKDLILKELQKSDGNKTEVANRLGISRRTLYRKLKQYNINTDR
ncbi:MAG: sigma-54-dependent Fis family transcriptional regulator [Candidatus Aureabacteria bacterium]|nr:sigma-54-dependent Fis family transcriptional regulator [Candidatus Auribacterota bacterium]